MKKIFILFFFFSLLFASDQKNEFQRVFLITIDSIDEHWKEVYKGADDAISESGEKIILNWLAPSKKNDAEQLELLEYALKHDAGVIIMSLNSPVFLNETIKKASKNGVKFIFVDSNANLEVAQVVQTNNYTAGKVAARQMLKALKENKISSGNIGIISVNPYTQSLNDREKGFRETMQNEDFKVFSTRYSDGEPSRAKKETQMLLKIGIVGLFSTNEGASKGASAAIKEARSNITAVGFDWPNDVEKLAKVGTFNTVIKQNPYQMGYESMKSAIKLLKNETLNSRFVDTGIEVITR